MVYNITNSKTTNNSTSIYDTGVCTVPWKVVLKTLNGFYKFLNNKRGHNSIRYLEFEQN